MAAINDRCAWNFSILAELLFTMGTSHSESQQNTEADNDNALLIKRHGDCHDTRIDIIHGWIQLCYVYAHIRISSYQ